MFGSERETPPSRLPLVGPSVAHSGAGSVNVNEGAGFQSNPTLSGGSHNQQFNAERIYYTGSSFHDIGEFSFMSRSKEAC